ncbi:MAG: DM9 repeat-containing protein, partial [Deltaproteobacteria bacterium]
IQYADIETGWLDGHEDFPAYTWERGWNFSFYDHGAAAVGVTAAPWNGYGIDGMAPDVSVHLYGIVQAIPPWDPAGTINLAASRMSAGDVILIEQHFPGADPGPCPSNWQNGSCNSCAQWGFVPAEWDYPSYQAIAYATARGIVVIEPAGNGGQNLDDTRYNGAFNRAFFDSGAIMVGAINSTNRAQPCWTDYGSRVDVSAWGDGVASLGYGGFMQVNGPNDSNQFYSWFSGTSSASAVIAGVAASTNGMRRQAQWPPLASANMAQTFRNTGTATSTVPQPNLYAVGSDYQTYSRGNAQWTLVDTVAGGTPPSGWLVAGTEYVGGVAQNLGVCSVAGGGYRYPGKMVSNHCTFRIPGSSSNSVSTVYWSLSAAPSSSHWTYASGGSVPSGAVPTGELGGAGTDNLYTCRFTYGSNNLVGFVRSGGCHATMETGSEQVSSSYYVLMIDPQNNRRIQGQNSMVMEDSNFSSANWAPVGLWFDFSFSNQRWSVWADGTIRNNYSGMCLEVLNWVGQNGQPLVQFPCHGGTNQQWNVSPSGELVGLASMCADTPNGNWASGQALQIKDCVRNSDQHWTVY